MKPVKTSFPISGYWDSRQGGRPENQDACGFIDTDKGLILVVCDGMGGGPGGKTASTTAVQKIVEYVVNAPDSEPRKEMVRNAIEYAHHAIQAKGTEVPALRGMGSTATVVLIDKQSAVLGHVGDTRIYQFRRGRKIFRTADHSMVAELVRNGTLTEEQARLSSQSNIITKALGGRMENLAEVCERPYEAGDRFMMCTDGIWGAMPERELIKRAAKTPSVSGAVDSIVIDVDETGRNNGNHHDNLTIALFDTKQDSILKEKMSKKTLRILLGLAALCLLSVIFNIVLTSRLKAPSPYQKQVAELTQTLEEKGRQIEQYKKDIDSLKDSINHSKERAVASREQALQASQKSDKELRQVRDELDKAQKEVERLKTELKNAQAATRQRPASTTSTTRRR